MVGPPLKVDWTTPRWLKGRAFASQAVDRGSILGRDISKSLKQVVTAPLPNARHYVRVSRVLVDEHFKRVPRVTVNVARYRTLTTQWQ